MTRSRKPPKRLFVDMPLAAARLALDQDQAHYLGRVLRCREGDELIVFNARGSERRATIRSLGRNVSAIELGKAVEPVPEPATPVFLLQALVKSDAMDLIVQKATELGVHAILASPTDFGVVRLDDERRRRRLAHWHRIAASACEQSGRHRITEVDIYDSLGDAVAALPADCVRIAFETGATGALEEQAAAAGLCIAIGPEGGFSPTERRWLEANDFCLRSLGPRTLRAETAAIAALAIAQLLHGALG